LYSLSGENKINAHPEVPLVDADPEAVYNSRLILKTIVYESCHKYNCDVSLCTYKYNCMFHDSLNLNHKGLIFLRCNLILDFLKLFYLSKFHVVVIIQFH
jgi:hypothetical protein